MDHRLLAYAERAAPRYTSYPTAPFFTDAVGPETFRAWLGALPADEPLSLYIHVPYCRDMCWYCGCNTQGLKRDEPLEAYVETLLREIDLAAQASPARRVLEMHWGGGTPTILSPERFNAIMAHLKARFDLSELKAHAVESDPRLMTPELAEAYAAAGVNRVSFGVQDLNKQVQEAIGRVQSFALVKRAVQQVRAAGIEEISLDLMYGLPRQSLADIDNSVAMAASLKPARIALFGYAHVPWFKPRQRLIEAAALPGAGLRFEQAETARRALEAEGYVAIGLDHFARIGDSMTKAAREGALKRNFQGYVAAPVETILGFGPSAISTLPQGYAQNAAQTSPWRKRVEDGDFAIVRGVALSQDDKTRRALIERIMCDFKVDLGAFGGRDAYAAEIERMAPLIEDGLARLDGDILIIPEDAKPFCRLIAQAFDAYAALGVGRHSRAV